MASDIKSLRSENRALLYLEVIMSKKMRLEFNGFEEFAERLDKLGGDLTKTTEKALK